MAYLLIDSASTRSDDPKEEARSLVEAKIEISGSGIMSKKSILIVNSPEAKKQIRAFRDAHKKSTAR